MLFKSIIKLITIGHSQHGKSSIAGFLFPHLARELLTENKYNKLFKILSDKVSDCTDKYNYPDDLKYALVFDGARLDIYQDTKDPYKSFTTKPFTLNIKGRSTLTEVTDLPGHQSFISRLAGAFEVADVGIFVIEAPAAYKAIVKDPNYKEIKDYTMLRGNSKKGGFKVRAPIGYKYMLDARQEEARKKRRGKRDRKVTAENKLIKTIKDRMAPPVLAGIFNYLNLAWHMGIRHFIFAIHKMDRIENINEDSKKVYDEICKFIETIKSILDTPDALSNGEFYNIPTAIYFSQDFGCDNDVNIVTKNDTITEWYKGDTILNTFLKIKEKLAISYGNNAELSPFRFQIDRYKIAPAGGRETHFNPYIHGYLSSGHLSDHDRISFPIRDDPEEYYGPVRISLHKSKQGKELKKDKLYPGMYHKIWLTPYDIKSASEKYRHKAIYFGNYAVKTSEINKKPVVVSNEIVISFTFIGGWLYRSNFHATLIYGNNKTEAEFIPENVDLITDGKRIQATAKLRESIPFSSLSDNLRYGKAIIEKHTYIIGIGTVLRV